MKLLFSLLFITSLCAFTLPPDNKTTNNPFFNEWKTLYQTPPYNEIKNEHFLPALIEGMQRQKVEIDAIINNQAEPSFENTIEALEKSGELLTKVNNVFSNLLSANTNSELQQISQESSPLLSKHYDDINLNEKLFNRIKAVYQKKNTLPLNSEQKRLLERYFKDFTRRGANLNAEEKEKFRKINEELSVLSLKFNENILKETNAFALVIDDEKDLSGLPASAINAAKEEAAAKGYENKWVFTLHGPSYRSFIRYADNRTLREKIYNASNMIANNDNEFDNKKIVQKIISLRYQKARLLGYKTFADYVLDDYMAQNPQRVYDFLLKLWEPIITKTGNEIQALKDFAASEGKTTKFEPWDLSYYAQKLKKAKYNLDDEMLRPYFKLENVFTGLFAIVNKLYGIQLVERKDIQVYNEDVKVFEVKNSEGKHLGLLYADYFPRENKQGGAWCGIIRDQNNMNGVVTSPVTFNVGSLSKPTSDKPSLLTLREVETLYHEFGHALNNLFSNVTYPRLTGANVAWDFIELPSQIMENWASDPEVLKMYAKHYQTGEVIPDELIKKIKDTELYNVGISTTSSLLFPALIDMDYHTRTDDSMLDVKAFEEKTFSKYKLVPELGSPYPSTQNGHIMPETGGYAAGYYSYIWAAVLDADAFELFKEKGIFNKDVADSFKQNILAKGNSDDPLVLYKIYRGREPKVDALLKKLGVN